MYMAGASSSLLADLLLDFVRLTLKETYTDQAKLTVALNGTKANKEAFLKLCYKKAIF